MTKSSNPLSVSEALARRKSIRAFLPKPVDMSLVSDLLDKARRSPSGCNFQPWEIHVISGDCKKELTKIVCEKLSAGQIEAPEYPIQPEPLWEPLSSRFSKMGEMMYGKAGIERQDAPARLDWLCKNYDFFGAPVGLFFTLDKRCGLPQWGDVGMFMQSFMLLALEAGLDTCPQECWAMFAPTVKAHLNIGDDKILWSGMSLGFRDSDAPINNWESERAEVESFATFY